MLGWAVVNEEIGQALDAEPPRRDDREAAACEFVDHGQYAEASSVVGLNLHERRDLRVDRLTRSGPNQLQRRFLFPARYLLTDKSGVSSIALSKLSIAACEFPFAADRAPRTAQKGW